MGKLSKEMLGLAGEYAVASELCRRGLYSQLTLGNHKMTDILIETDVRMLRISVKAKQGTEWPTISGPLRADDFLVLVDFMGKGAGDRLDFYILGHGDWEDFSGQIIAGQKEKGVVPSVKDGRITWPDGWTGINIKPANIQKYKENWGAILSSVEPSQTVA